MIVFPPADGGLYEEVRGLLPAEERVQYDAWMKEFFDYGRLFKRSERELTELNAGIIPFYEHAVSVRATAANPTALKPMSVDASLAPAVGGWMMQAIFFSMGRKHDWTAAFAKIAAPVTILLGTNDLTPLAAFDQYRVIPNANVVKLESSDHFLFANGERFAAYAAPFFE